MKFPEQLEYIPEGVSKAKVEVDKRRHAALLKTRQLRDSGIKVVNDRRARAHSEESLLKTNAILREQIRKKQQEQISELDVFLKNPNIEPLASEILAIVVALRGFSEQAQVPFELYAISDLKAEKETADKDNGNSNYLSLVVTADSGVAEVNDAAISRFQATFERQLRSRETQTNGHMLTFPDGTIFDQLSVTADELKSLYSRKPGAGIAIPSAFSNTHSYDILPVNGETNGMYKSRFSIHNSHADIHVFMGLMGSTDIEDSPEKFGSGITRLVTVDPNFLANTVSESRFPGDGDF